jgi:hypothetical protein
VSADEVALDRYEGRHRLIADVADLARATWLRIDPRNLDSSWARIAARLQLGVAGAQLAAARGADGYLDEVLDEQNISPMATADVAPDALAGVASDGRPLDSLLYSAVVTAKVAFGGGAPTGRAMAAGYASLDMIVRTQIADAGRVADQLALVARPDAGGYVRKLVGASCPRCVVLAGRWYRWNAGFDRHPSCNCVGVPANEAIDEITTNPRQFFDGLSRAEQDKAFTLAGAQAIRDGADIGQVVNARRGALGLSTAGGRITAEEARLLRGGRKIGRLQPQDVFGQQLFTTTEGTTVRGRGGVALGARVDGVRRPGDRYRSARAPRLMPESIYKIAGNDRDEALRLLRRNGYLTDTAPRSAAPRMPAVARTSPARRLPPVPSAPKPVRSVVPAASTLGDRVKAGVVHRQVLSGGQNAATELLTLADGSKVVFKKAKPIEGQSARAQQDAEELAPLVLRAAGLRAPEIYRPTANQLYMEYMQGTIASKFKIGVSGLVDPDAYDRDQRWLLGLVDQVIDNYDRNSGNFLIGPNREALGIDHGFAFQFYGTSAPDRPMVPFDDHPGRLFHGKYPHLNSWVDNDLSPADLALFRSRLVALLPEFERIGRADWHGKMLIRLTQIEAHARGTKRRIREA